MHTHAPDNYVCPICLGINREKSTATLIVPTDIIFQNKLASIIIGSFGIGTHPGHVLIVPNQHYENIFDIPIAELSAINSLSQHVAHALKQVLQAEGITILQNNEPAGGQHAFHYHMHIFPRFAGDQLHERMSDKQLVPEQSRQQLTDELKNYFAKFPIHD